MRNDLRLGTRNRWRSNWGSGVTVPLSRDSCWVESTENHAGSFYCPKYTFYFVNIFSVTKTVAKVTRLQRPLGPFFAQRAPRSVSYLRFIAKLAKLSTAVVHPTHHLCPQGPFPVPKSSPGLHGAFCELSFKSIKYRFLVGV